jgi:hypothetical protein
MAELLVLIILCILALGILFWVVYLFIGDLAGAPFVPVSDRVLTEILREMKMKKGGEFWDLGSGNGKAVIMAALDYKVRARGAEINPMLVIFSRIKVKLNNFKQIIFYRKNIFRCDLTNASYIYFYLYTGTVEKVSLKIDRECKPGTVVASRGFEIKRWKNKLTKVIETDKWKSYLYKV